MQTPVPTLYALDMSNARTYTLRVVFDQKQLEILRRVRLVWLIVRMSLDSLQAGYRVCIAKVLNNKYDTVWSAQE